MEQVHLILGPQGAGKSTYAQRLAQETRAVRFSIDEWMQHLFAPDLPSTMSLPWIMARVGRCETQIWSTASQICRADGRVVLDLGFTRRHSRDTFRELAARIGAPVRLHVLDAPHALRKERVMRRNVDQGETFSFEVTPMMFDAMEQMFEPPTQSERAQALIVTASCP